MRPSRRALLRAAALRCGWPWIPKGVVVTGLLAPRGYIRGTYAQAGEIWGDRLLRQFQDIGVDSLRLTLSIAGLDPTNAMPDGKMDAAQKQAYLKQISAAVDQAERYGMTSLLTLAHGEVSGVNNAEHTPGPEAARAWAVLAKAYANRPSVFFDAFNEPTFGGAASIDTDPSPWKSWHSSYQLMVDTIRKTGARNVIVLDSISTSRVWRKNTDGNIPNDPVHQLAFDIHPYPTDSSFKRSGGSTKLDYYRVADIEHYLDGWCTRHACIVSEFFTGIGRNPDKANCYDNKKIPGVDSPQIAASFVDYFTRNRIGVFIFTGDWKFRLFDHPGKPGARLTSFANFKDCSGDKSMGPGELMRYTWLKIGR